MNGLSGATGRLADFIFSRRRDLELECNYVLAGMLVTNIPKDRQLSESDQRLIGEVIEKLRVGMKNVPDLDEADIWLDGKPEDALAPPYDEDLLLDRCRRCHCILVTCGDHVQVPSDLARQIVGGTDH